MSLHPKNPYRKVRKSARRAFLAEVDVVAAEHRAKVMEGGVRARVRAVKALTEGLAMLEDLGTTPATAKLKAALVDDLADLGLSLTGPGREDGPEDPFETRSLDSTRPIESPSSGSATPEPKALNPPEEPRLPGRPKGSRDSKPRKPRTGKPAVTGNCQQTANGEPPAANGNGPNGKL